MGLLNMKHTKPTKKFTVTIEESVDPTQLTTKYEHFPDKALVIHPRTPKCLPGAEHQLERSKDKVIYPSDSFVCLRCGIKKLVNIKYTGDLWCYYDITWKPALSTVKSITVRGYDVTQGVSVSADDYIWEEERTRPLLPYAQWAQNYCEAKEKITRYVLANGGTRASHVYIEIQYESGGVVSWTFAADQG